jgi:hypothetical protein
MGLWWMVLIHSLHSPMITPVMVIFTPYGERSEALEKFKVFKAEVENQHDAKIKVARSDCGGEYYGRHTLYGQVPDLFAEFLQENGIVIQYSVPYEPQ